MGQGPPYLLLFRGPPWARRGRGGKSPQGRPQDAGQFAVRPWMACQRTSAASSRSRPASSGRPRPRGCPSLWLLSLGQARESDSLAGCERNTQGCGSVFARSNRAKARNWVPAFAGTTKVGAFAGTTSPERSPDDTKPLAEGERRDQAQSAPLAPQRHRTDIGVLRRHAHDDDVLAVVRHAEVEVGDRIRNRRDDAILARRGIEHVHDARTDRAAARCSKPARAAPAIRRDAPG